MAGIYLIFVFALIAILFQKRTWAISLFFLGLAAGALMFWHHATNILQINW